LALQVVLHRLAVKEARGAETWYASRSLEVAERFRTAALDAATADFRRRGDSSDRPVVVPLRSRASVSVPLDLLPRVEVDSPGCRRIARSPASRLLAATEMKTMSPVSRFNSQTRPTCGKRSQRGSRNQTQGTTLSQGPSARRSQEYDTELRPAGLEPASGGLEVFSVKAASDLGDGQTPACTPACTDSRQSVASAAQSDSELCRIVAAWQTLPESIRRAMLTLVGA